MLHRTLPFLLLVAFMPATRAAVKTWDGSSNGNWATGANWSGNTAPVAGDDLVFPTGVTQLVTTNNFSPNRAFNSITILGANYVLRGNPMILTNGLRCGNASAANAIDAAITVQASQTFIVSNAAASLLLLGTNIALGSSTLTLNGNGRIDISNAITGAGSIIKQGANTVLFQGNGANTYSGNTTVNAGMLRLSKTNVLAVSGPLVVGDGVGGSDVDVVQLLRANQIADTAAVTVNSSGLLDCSLLPPGGNETINSLDLNNGGHVLGPNGGTLFIRGNINCTGNILSVIEGNGYLFPTGAAPVITVSGSSTVRSFQISMILLGNGTLSKEGPGWLVLQTPAEVPGDYFVNAGTLELMDKDGLGLPGHNTTVASGATLSLNGVGITNQSLTLNGTGVGGTLGALRSTAPSGINNFWSGSITLASDAVINILGTGVGSMTHLSIIGAVSGAGRLIKNGGGFLHLAGTSANTYSGGTTLIDGYLDLVKTSGQIAVPGNVIVGTDLSGASPDFHLSSGNQIANGFDVTLATNGYFDLSSFSATIGTLNGYGRVTLGPGSALTVSPDSGTCTYRGRIDDNGTLIKAGNGTLVLTGTNTYTGITALSAGTLQVDGSQPWSPITISGSGRLTGSGIVGDVTPISAACVVAPGHSPGILTCSNFNLGGIGSGVLQIELNGATPGSGYDQLAARGNVGLTGIALAASLNFASSQGNQFTLIRNDGPSLITGTFTGLPQNATLLLGGQLFRITYTGGDGNSVVLTQLSGPLAPLLRIESINNTAVRLLWSTNTAAGFGLQSNTNLTTANWIGVTPPPVIIGTDFVVTNSISGGRTIYRLFKP